MVEPDLLIHVPIRVRGNTEGYDFLSTLAAETMVITHSKLVLDFKQCKWFEGNLCAVLGSILDGVKARQNKIYLRGLQPYILKAFTRNKFLDNFGDKPIAQDSLTLQYTKFGLDDEQMAMEYLASQLFDKKDMPQMSLEARKQVMVALFEVCVNALTHGDCTNVYVCGQIFPNRTNPEVLLTFADLGRTIKANVNEFLKGNLSGNKTVLWALDDRNTTKIGTTGGLGLKILESLVLMNQGSLQIVSGDGFVEADSGYRKEFEMGRHFPGTIVTIKLRLKDDNFYYMSNEVKVDLDDIF